MSEAILHWACWLSCLILPIGAGLWWWKRRHLSWDELELHARREELATRKRTGLTPVPPFKSAAPSLAPDAITPQPLWVDDPAPIFDRMVEQVIASSSQHVAVTFVDSVPDNDNASASALNSTGEKP